jgi:hypothetical protein
MQNRENEKPASGGFIPNEVSSIRKDSKFRV